MNQSKPGTTHSLLSEAFQSTLDEYTHTQLREGNRILFLPSGVQSYEKRWELIEKARHHIHIVAFSLMRDDTSWQLRDKLLEKLKSGVKVRLIFDDGVMYSTFSGYILKQLESAGAETIRYHKIFRDWWPDFAKGRPFKQVARTFKFKLKRHFHEKYMIVDGREAILGGINWGNKYAFGGKEPKAWRDTDVWMKGPVVHDIQRRFIHDFFLYRAMDEEYVAKKEPGFDREAFYARAMQNKRRFEEDTHRQLHYFPPPDTSGEVKIRYIPHKPYDEKKLNLTETFLLMFREAKDYIYWGCHGIRPPRVLAEALIDARKRGVEVRLITNSKRSSRTLMMRGLLGWMYWESSNHFYKLIENGIRVFEWQKPGAFHSKNIVIDGVVASVGSYNIARGSAFHHTESNVVVFGGRFPREVRNQFDIDLLDCEEITLDKAKKVKPKYDPYRRILHEHNLLLPQELLPEDVLRDLKAGKIKYM